VERIVATYLANSHERAEAIEQVLSENLARNVWLQPTDRSHGMTVGCRRVRTGNLTNGNLRCRLQWHNNEITFLDCIAELIELCSEVQLRLVFLIWQSLLNDPEYRFTVLGGSEIANIETENKLTLSDRPDETLDREVLDARMHLGPVAECIYRLEAYAEPPRPYL
jgi:hypothetical protein